MPHNNISLNLCGQKETIFKVFRIKQYQTFLLTKYRILFFLIFLNYLYQQNILDKFRIYIIKTQQIIVKFKLQMIHTSLFELSLKNIQLLQLIILFSLRRMGIMRI
ncbi:hypothetical protein pb186bvf_008478 [Paramecium bursaria]